MLARATTIETLDGTVKYVQEIIDILQIIIIPRIQP
jgi:hypothetical protein